MKCTDQGKVVAWKQHQKMQKSNFQMFETVIIYLERQF